MVTSSFRSIQPRVETRLVMERRRETPGSGTEAEVEQENKFVTCTRNCRKCDKI